MALSSKTSATAKLEMLAAKNHLPTNRRNQMNSRSNNVRRTQRHRPTEKPKSSRRSNGMNARGKSASMTSTVERSIPLFPVRTYRMLRYADEVSVTSVSGVPASYVFTANGLYDPNITGTGHQPMGFDAIMLCYEHYHVQRADVRIIARNSTTASCFVYLRVDADSSPLANPQQLVENGRLIYDTLGPNNSPNGFKELSLSIDIPRTQGMTRGIFLANDNLRGSVAANPAEQTYIHMGIWDQANQSTAAQFQVTITYHSYFTEPRPQTTSFRLQRESDLVADFEALTLPPQPSVRIDETKAPLFARSPQPCIHTRH